MAQRISEGRKATYYVGMVLAVVGFLLFASVFVTSIANIGDFSNFEGDMKSGATRAFLGIGLIVAGGIVRGIGARGVAGSGVVLDPERARKDLEPYSRMGGGMVKDALDEAGIQLGGSARGGGEKVVMVKCRACGKLNEEDSKFCQECGQAI